jgi:hypothetical protein
LVGKKFRIKYVDSPYYDDMAGLLTNDRMISFEEVE